MLEREDFRQLDLEISVEGMKCLVEYVDLRREITPLTDAPERIREQIQKRRVLVTVQVVETNLVVFPEILEPDPGEAVLRPLEGMCN
jgi:hypothetical protein